MVRIGRGQCECYLVATGIASDWILACRRSRPLGPLQGHASTSAPGTIADKPRGILWWPLSCPSARPRAGYRTCPVRRSTPRPLKKNSDDIRSLKRSLLIFKKVNLHLGLRLCRNRTDREAGNPSGFAVDPTGATCPPPTASSTPWTAVTSVQ